MMKTRATLAITLLCFAGVALVALGKFLDFAASPTIQGSTQLTVIEVNRGEPPTTVIQKLMNAGAITHARRFHWLGRIQGDWPRVKAGEYQVGPGMAPKQILTILTSGLSMQHPVTVREGQNMYEVADAIAAQSLTTREKVLAAVRDPALIQALWGSMKFSDRAPAPKTLEGYLFPDTYFFNRTMSVEDMLRQMVRRFSENWTDGDAKRAASLGLTRHQAVTLASMIEKETGSTSERPMISSVFHNRLSKRMRLQSDPTTIYGIWDRYVEGGSNIRKEHLTEKNEYNTYVVPALPMGPIGNPGRESIQAALYPATSEFLFFVSHNDGTHAFTKTYGDHMSAVKKFQLDRKAREGKSWREQYKKERSLKSQGGA